MKEKLIISLKEITDKLGVPVFAQNLDYPENHDHGDFSTNVAMINAKKIGQSPKALAEKIVGEFKGNMPEFLKDVSMAGPGFINFFVKDRFFAEEVLGVLEKDGVAGEKNKDIYGKSNEEKDNKVMVEYTDPNAFKVFHIGHLMSNAIGESISRLIEYSGASVIRICYPFDIGLHIAKSIWAISNTTGQIPPDSAPIQERTDFLGKMYVLGTNAYKADPAAKDSSIINFNTFLMIPTICNRRILQY